MASIRQRVSAGGEKSYRVEIRKKKAGKVIFRESRTFAKKAMAERWAKKREAELDDPDFLRSQIARQHSGNMTFGDLIDEYIKKVKPLKPWGRSKDYTLSLLKKYPIADLDPIEMTSQDVVNHVVARIQEDGVKPQTATLDYMIAREVFSIAKPMLNVPVSLTVMDEARTTLIKLGAYKKSDTRERRPEIQEITDIVESLNSKRKSTRFNATKMQMDRAVVFAMFSSRRSEEICRITWEDWDEDKQTIMVRDMKHPGDKVGNDVLCFVPDEAAEIIKVMPEIDERIFPYNNKTMTQLFRDTRAQCGYHKGESESLRFHDLRHECISWLFERDGYNGQRWDIPRVQKVSGHRSWTSLQKYENMLKVEPHDRWEDWEWKKRVLED